MSSNRFNKILVIDSIPEGEINTAKRLYEDIETYANAYQDSPVPEYIRIESGEELIRVLSECQKLAISNDIYPMLHIECHGNEDGFQFANGSILDWRELKIPLTDLNEAMRLNLMIAVAACVGAALAKVIRMGDKAPFWGLIGPTDLASPSELEGPYRALYQTLIKDKSPEKAIAAFEQAAKLGLFWRTTAQGLFEKVWALYKEEYCNETILEERITRMQLKAPHLDRAKLKELLQNHEPVAFERYRSNYFMCDKYPEHVERFPVEYKS